MQRAVAETGPLAELQQHFVMADGVLVAAREPIGLGAEEAVEALEFLLGEFQFEALQQESRAAHVAGAELLFGDAQQRPALDGLALAGRGEALPAESFREAVALRGGDEIAGLRVEIAPMDGGFAHGGEVQGAVILDDAFVKLRGLLKFFQIIPLEVRAGEQHGDFEGGDFARGPERFLHELHCVGAAALAGEGFHQGGLEGDAAFHIEVGLREQMAREFLDERPAVRLFGDEEEVEGRVEALRVPAAPVAGGKNLDGPPERMRAGRNRHGPHVDALRDGRRARAGVQGDAIFAGLEINVRRRTARGARAVAEVPLDFRRVGSGAVRLEAHEVQRLAGRAEGVVHAPREGQGGRAVRAFDPGDFSARGGRKQRGGHGGGGELFVHRVALEIERAVGAVGGGAADVVDLEGMHAGGEFDLAPRAGGDARDKTSRAGLLEDAVGVDEKERGVFRADVEFVGAVLGDAQETAVGRGEVAHVVGARGVHVLHDLIDEAVGDDGGALFQAGDDVGPACDGGAGPVAELDGDAFGERGRVGVRGFRVARVGPVARVGAAARELDERLAIGLMREDGDRQHAAVLGLHANVRAVGAQPAGGREAGEDGFGERFFVGEITEHPQRETHAITGNPRGRGQRCGGRGRGGGCGRGGGGRFERWLDGELGRGGRAERGCEKQQAEREELGPTHK